VLGHRDCLHGLGRPELRVTKLVSLCPTRDVPLLRGPAKVKGEAAKVRGEVAKVKEDAELKRTLDSR